MDRERQKTAFCVDSTQDDFQVLSKIIYYVMTPLPPHVTPMNTVKKCLNENNS